MWFNSDGEQRFDLRAPHGTLYAAVDPLGCLVEVFRETALVDARDVEARRLSVLSPRRHLDLADCTVRNARRFGITGALHSGPAYEITQRWAEAFHQSGFEGIRYLLSHDPAQRLVGYALFGAAGEADVGGDLEVVATSEIDRAVLDSLATGFGITVLPGLLDVP